MEFLIYLIAAVSIGLVLLKPTREKLAFRLLMTSFLMSVALYTIGSWGALLSYWNV
ncbi:MAG: hypothetical protein Q4P71_07585 [Actinomycetaceae bacterium]|nr:hypothetical protein [Actinomycetaceae bacterium]